MKKKEIKMFPFNNETTATSLRRSTAANVEFLAIVFQHGKCGTIKMRFVDLPHSNGI